ncbi:hypothetical protein [Inquilinus limosus]|uniref:Uncharacterized protein n=1 Tax=Inquilinus limosus TaxID=171674 RepID=A0A211YS95_9PROT|nr:hypothetical protein [Inquilinus limosus]OWJ55912.1 hypothetical protein BWR60_35595 [Inquilinus limosus]
MHDATQIRPAPAGTGLAAAPAIDPERIEPGWRPPVDRLALSWNEVAAGWLAAGGLLAILGVAAILGREPVGDPVYRSAGLPGISPAVGAEICQAPTPAKVANPFILAPRPPGRA